MSNGNFLWILVNRKLASTRGGAGLGRAGFESEMDEAWGQCWCCGSGWGGVGPGQYWCYDWWLETRTTSELIIALPTAYITTVAVSVRSNGVYIFFSMISTL